MRHIATASLLFIITLLGACGTSGDRPDSAITPGGPAGAPVALAPRRGGAQSIVMAVNQEEVAKAVERLRITKKKAASPFEQAGADLNGDGQAEAIVLLTGQDWCSPQGCTLAIFQTSEFGYRPVSQIIGVKPPAAVGAGANAGWRDLIVKTGSGKPVRLQFTGGGYPSNAAGQPDAMADIAQAEMLIAPVGQNIAAASPQQGAGNPQ